MVKDSEKTVEIKNSEVIRTVDTVVKNPFEKLTVGYILKHGNRKARRAAAKTLKRRK